MEYWTNINTIIMEKKHTQKPGSRSWQCASRVCKTLPRLTTGQNGFTLVELMVSLTLFTIVVLAVVSSLYTVNNASRKVQGMRIVMDNLNFAVESMSRTIRTGSQIGCGSSSGVDCPFLVQGINDTLIVKSTFDGGNLVRYRLFGGVIQKSVNTSGFWGNWVALTTPEINVQNLSFYVDGANSADTKQTNVQIFVNGIATAASEVAPFAIQTYVSQRAAE